MEENIKNAPNIKPIEGELCKNYIQRILSSRKNERDENFYQEKHHILPKCMGGDNSKENLIYLYAQEHFWIHKMLTRENPEIYKLHQAWYLMCHTTDNGGKSRYEISSEEFEEARINISKVISKSNKGRKRTDEQKKRISECHADISGEKNPMYGKHHSDETKEKLHNANIGKTMSEESRKKISKSLKGREISEKTRESARQRLAAHTGENHYQARKVRCLNTGDIFGCAMDAGTWAGLKGKNPGTSIIKFIKHPDKINYAGHVPTTGEPAHWKYVEE